MADFPVRENLYWCFVQRSVENVFVSSVLFTDEAHFGSDGIINIRNQHQWAEEKSPGVIHSRHQHQLSISVWAGIVECRPFGRPACFVNNGLQATITEISSYMICQSYWKMYHWQSEPECGTCMMVLRHILAALCEMFSIS
jgi:hypothetical protein